MTMTDTKLPESKLTKSQRLKFGPKVYHDGGEKLRITAEVRHDDECGNGHNSFSITATIDRIGKNGHIYEYSGGCCHDEVAKHFPELAPFIRWHLSSTDGPMHYMANALYWAGHSGWRDGKPNSPPNLEYLKSTIVYGSLPEDEQFDLSGHLYSDARGFTWNEAKANELKDWLAARQEKLMAEFKRDVESLGFVY